MDGPEGIQRIAPVKFMDKKEYFKILTKVYTKKEETIVV